MNEFFPALKLGNWPTPVHLLERLSQAWEAEIWIKRDDLSGEVYGGNKVRKLEFLLGAAKAAGAQRIVTLGAGGSNHVVATAIYGRQQGLPLSAILAPQPVNDYVRHNVQLMQALDIEFIWQRARPFLPLALLQYLRQHPRTYVIGAGGSSPLGCLGFVNAARELRQQIDEKLLPMPDEIILPLGSGGTMAGLVVGARAVGLGSHLRGVRVVEAWLMNEVVLSLLIARTTRLLTKSKMIDSKAETSLRKGWSIAHNFVGAGYGVPTAAAQDAVQTAWSLEGLRLETTYSGKSLAAVREQCRHHRRGTPRRKILFWHTFNSRDTTSLLHQSANAGNLPPEMARWLKQS